MSCRFLLFMLVILTFSLNVFAYDGGYLPSFSLPNPEQEAGWEFIRPNEENPGDAIPIFHKVPRGVYVSIGSERSFIGAALTPNATHLFIFDIDAKIVRFSRINTALLKLSKNRKDYLWLRLEAKKAEWRKRAKASKELVHTEVSLLSDSTTWSWWKVHVREFNKFKYFHAPIPKSETDFAFRNANYLFYESLFQRISQMAKANRIESHRIDLRDLDSLSKVNAAFIEANLNIAAIDLSNAWSPEYTGPKNAYQLVEIFRASAKNNSLLILVGNEEPRYETRPEPRFKNRVINAWSYRAFTFDYISSCSVLPQLEEWPQTENLTLNGSKL